MRKKIYRIFSNLTIWPFFLCGTAIILIDLLSHTEYSCRKLFVFPNIVLLVLGLLLTIGLFLLFTFFKAKKDPVNILTVILFLLQMYIAFNIYRGAPTWDEGIIIGNAMHVAAGETELLDNVYFSSFPNNQLILFIDAVLLKCNSLFGIFDTDNGLLFIILIQCLLSSFGGKLLYEIIRDEAHSFRAAMTGWLSYAFLIALSGWNIVIYTDPMGVVFPVAVLRIYQLTKQDNKRFYFRWGAITFLSYVGYKIKPTALIVFIAIVGVEIIQLIKKCNAKDLFVFGKTCVSVLIAFIIGNLVCSSAIKSTGLNINSEADTGPLHMIMIGLNPVNNGVWYAEDVNASMTISSKEERTAMQKQVIKQRLHDYGIKGLLHHQWKRTLTTFNDGTFAWGMEGGFYNTIYPEKNSVVTAKLRNIYYNDGSYYLYWSSLEQMTWLVVLFLSLGIVILKKKRLNQVIGLSLFGTILFNEIFEARARYIYLYVPFFIIAAALSTEKMMGFFGGKIILQNEVGKFDKIKALYEKYQELILYAFFGVLTTLVNIIVYWVCAHPLGLPVMASTIIAWVLAVLFAYATNRKWVFHSESSGRKAIVKEMILFFGARLATGVIDWASMFVFVDIIGMNDVLIKTLANILVIVVNYLASKLIIFKKKNGL